MLHDSNTSRYSTRIMLNCLIIKWYFLSRPSLFNVIQVFACKISVFSQILNWLCNMYHRCQDKINQGRGMGQEIKMSLVQNEWMCVSVNMRSHETPQDWIQLLIIIANKSTEAEHVITAPCTLQPPQKQPSLISMFISHSPLGETFLALSSVRGWMYTLNTCMHMSTDAPRGQRQVDPSEISHEPSSYNLMDHTKTLPPDAVLTQAATQVNNKDINWKRNPSFPVWKTQNIYVKITT